LYSCHIVTPYNKIARFQVVEYLLRNHASLQTVDSFGRTALDHATTDDVKALLQSARSQLGGRSTCWMPCDDVTSSRKYDLQHSQHAQLLAAAYPPHCAAIIY